MEDTKNPHSVEWNQLEKAITAFEQFLHSATSHAKIPDWHVIFSMGSVVRLTPEELETTQQFTGYNGEYVADYPMHRLQDENILPDIIKQNTIVWERQLKTGEDVGKALRAGYQVLVNDGYPYPGGEGSDRMPIPTSEKMDGESYLWSIIWFHRNRSIINLAFADDPMSAVGAGGELRRYDVMFPKVVAVISPDLVITRID